MMKPYLQTYSTNNHSTEYIFVLCKGGNLLKVPITTQLLRNMELYYQSYIYSPTDTLVSCL